MKRLLISTLLLVSILFATSITSIGQVMPSPASQGVIGNQNHGVGPFAGNTNISVPLFAATANNGASVPVGISYNTSGIKVNQTATPVGLGWNLYAGGTITRVIRGVPDEYANMIADPTSLNHDQVSRVLSGNLDGEKDLFYLSFPGGGGRFIFEGDFHEYFTETVWCHDTAEDLTACQEECDGDDACIINCQSFNIPRLACDGRVSWENFQTLPYSDIHIKYYFDGYTEGNWEVTDLNGVKYTFGATEVTTLNSTEPDGTVYNPDGAYDYVSSWHLSSITYPDLPSSHGITFSYSDPMDLVQEELSRKTYATAPKSGGALSFERTEVTRNKTEIGVRYLEGIHFTKGDIAFSYSDEREDLPGAKRLVAVSLSDKLGQEVSTFSFDQDYFSSRYSYYQGSTNTFCGNSAYCKRLKLSAIYKDGAFVRSFLYKNELDYVPSVGINYYELPPRDSYYTDHWGYNNGGDHQGSTYVPYGKLTGASIQERPSASYSINGMDKSAKIYAQANILSRVNFPTGGYTFYTYSNHSIGGGVRFDKIETFTEADVLVAGTSFTYSQPQAYTNPIYHRSEELEYNSSKSRDRLALYQQSLASVFDLNGTSIGYGKVTATNLMVGSKVEYYYKNDLRLGQIQPNKGRYNVGNESGFIDRGAINDVNEAPYSTNSLIFYDRGKYDQIKVYGEEDHVNPIKVNTFNYENINATPYYTVPSLAIEIKKEYANSRDVLVSQYDMLVKTHRLLSTTETIYENGGEVSSTTNVTYHDDYPTLTSQIDVANSTGYSSRVLNSYPEDVTYSTKHDLDVLSLMMSKGMNGIVVQSESRIQFPGASGYVTGSVGITQYKSEHNLILPYKVYALQEAPKSSWIENDLTLMSAFMDYSNTGLLLSSKGFNEVVTAMHYDSYGFLERSVINPGTAYERETTYDNKRLVGLNQVTDPNGRMLRYEYDDRNRLLLTRDQDQNITARYRYHTVNDNNELNAEISVNWHVDGNYEDRDHQFSLSNMNCPYGNCTYTWNFGDGSGSKTGTQVNHTYSNSGSYQIKVTIANPEYTEPVVITQNVSIQAFEYWTLSMNGPTSHCIYDSNPPQSFGAVIGNGLSTCSPGGGYTYQWYYQYNSSGNFVPFGSGQSYEVWPQNTNATGTHKVRVVVTDSCGRSLTVTRTFTLIDSGSNCSSGGGSGPH